MSALPAPTQTDARASAATSLQRALGAMALAAALVLPFWLKDFVVFQLTLALIYAIAILGLNLLTGLSGQFSLGHSAFYAIGAYTAAILMEQAGVPYGLTLPAAGLVCFAFGSCSACRRCASTASISRSPPSRWRWRCRKFSNRSRSNPGPAACRASA